MNHKATAEYRALLAEGAALRDLLKGVKKKGQPGYHRVQRLTESGKMRWTWVHEDDLYDHERAHLGVQRADSHDDDSSEAVTQGFTRGAHVVFPGRAHRNRLAEDERARQQRAKWDAEPQQPVVDNESPDDFVMFDRKRKKRRK